MNNIIKPIDINQLFRDIKTINQPIESFELNWVEKKDLVPSNNSYPQVMTVNIESILVPVIRVKYYQSTISEFIEDISHE